MPSLVLLARAVALLPWRTLGGAGAAVGFVAGTILRIRRRHVEEAMGRAGLADAPALARGMYASLGTALLEFLWMVGRRAPLGSLVTLSAAARSVLQTDRAGAGKVSSPRAMVVATAHTGNWDLVACAAAREHLALSVVTKRLSLAWLDRFWQGERAAQGIELLHGPGIFARAVEALERGRSVAVLIDQAPERRSAATDASFMGQTARCDQMAALLAARTGARLILALGHRQPDGTHSVDVPFFVDPPRKASRAWLERTTRALHQKLEHFVREHPSQWLWLHRRWKMPVRPHRPASSRSDAEVARSSLVC